jgi:hypothetical protein
MADPPPAAYRKLDKSALPGGIASVAARTVGTLASISGLKRSTRPQMFFTAAGLRHPAGDRTTKQLPATKLLNACVSEPPTWKSGIPKSRLLPGLDLSRRLQAQA